MFEEITDFVLDIIKANAPISALLGTVNPLPEDDPEYDPLWSPDDPRIYQWEPPDEIEFSEEKKAAIFYRHNQNPNPVLSSYPAQKGNIYFYFQCVSYDKTIALDLAEKISNLIAPTENLGFSTTNWRIGYVMMNGNSDGRNEGTVKFPLYTRNLSLLFEGVFARG